MSSVDIARALPSIAEVRALSRAFATLDAVLGGGWPHTFDRAWRPGHELATMSDGGGDAYSIVFTPDGALLLGFDHESEMSPYGSDDYATWPGLVDDVPGVFSELLASPEFGHQGPDGPFLAATVCIWRGHDDPAWRTGDIEFPPGDDPDGASWLFGTLASATPETLLDYATRHAGRGVVELSDIKAVLGHRRLTSDLLERLNPVADPAMLAEALDRIG
ncbi:hypothetical protein [Actinomadura harenae]|uniref:Uncharacterized protein n=1 Tax=Actinomadura harenae TaxID=2483351 RepID=A0A3M2KUA2_9ACTN|nr:hypothetical protein [Actinomadura harenae]RMI29039.1 hypothetical protein EBO15_43385 [Actinomadura harenae]